MSDETTKRPSRPGEERPEPRPNPAERHGEERSKVAEAEDGFYITKSLHGRDDEREPPPDSDDE